jgi:hypothetical protein
LLGLDSCAKIPGMDIVKASWVAVIVGCVIAGILLAINGYTGYSITVGTVGAAAAVNLT